jgi:hypothetical protein
MRNRLRASLSLLATLVIVPAASADFCLGRVTIELDEEGLPTGPADLLCDSPCTEGCIKEEILILGPNGGSQPALMCACDLIGPKQQCCEVVLTPPNGSGGGVPWGNCGMAGCPSGNTCLGHYEIGHGVGTTTADCN